MTKKEKIVLEWLDGTRIKEISPSGTFWRRKGKHHREDGPAREWADGSKEWWLNGKEYTEEEFNRATKNDVPEYTMEEAIKLIGHEFKIKK